MHGVRLFHRWLLIGVLHVVSHPLRVLIVSAIVLAGTCGLAAWKLNISTDQNKLFDPNVQFFRDYLNFIKLFPENEAIYIVVETAEPKSSPPTVRWTELAGKIASRLRAMTEDVKAVDERVPLDQLGAQGILFESPAQLEQDFEQVKQFIPLAKLWAEKPGALTGLLGQTPLERFLTALQVQPADAQIADFVGALAKSWNATLEKPDEPLVVGTNVPDLSAMGATDPSRLGYYYMPDESDPSRSVLLVRVYLNRTFTSLTAISETVEAIRAAVRESASTFPDFRVGVTGRPALEADEMRTSDDDSRRAEIIALTAVFVGLVLMLRSVWLALAGEIALIVGIGWTFGWATVSVGELNLLSMVFLLALIGIGMDYLVQVLTRYRQEFLRRPRDKHIWIGVFRHVAAPINTACLGAAGAFLVSALTSFRGAAQLGIIAGGGLLLCLLAGYVILPALLTLFPPKLKRDLEPENIDLGAPAGQSRRGSVTTVIWLVLLAMGARFAFQTSFNPNLIELQAPNLESVKLVSKLQTWSSVVLTHNLDVLRLAREALGPSPLVKRTESILDAYENLDWLRKHEGDLPTVEWAEPMGVQENDLARIAGKADALARHFSSFAQAMEPLNAFAVRLNDKEAEGAKIATRLSAWQDKFVQQLKGVLAQFHPQPQLNLEALPIELKSHFIGTDGSFALYSTPKQDLWNRKDLADFELDVEARMKQVSGPFTLTGITSNVLWTTKSIEEAFHQATIYALVLIFILVLIDLRNLGQTLLAISVLAFGLPMLVSIMGLFGIDWNFANFFGLPILIGAGHEYGVFMVHRYREAIRDPRRIWRRWDVADKALLLCAYVTCVSFGFFWALGHHRGLRSLGLIMAVGTACIYLATIMVLRPLLLWRLQRQRNR